MIIKYVGKQTAAQFIEQHHYSKVMPKLTKYIYGGFVDDRLVAVMTLGWGVRPLHTIKKLFPSLSSADYLEIGKMCLLDEMPRNSESTFISMVIKHVRNNHPDVKLIFTWADGMVGKPGYVYQSANFLYGGFIWTDSYFTDKGEKIHPRSSRSLCNLNAEQTKKKMFWLTESFMQERGIKRYKGKQFRYVYFLCGKQERIKLLAESTVKWTLDFPKQDALSWKVLQNGKYIETERPIYTQSLTARETVNDKESIARWI